jgi:hypothetical protein
MGCLNSPAVARLKENSRKKKEAEMANETSRMTDDEMIAILEEIPRNPKSYPSARITAIRTLRDFSPEDPEPTDAFAELDRVRPRRKARLRATVQPEVDG